MNEVLHKEVFLNLPCKGDLGWDKYSRIVEVSKGVFIKQWYERCKGCGVERLEELGEIKFGWHLASCENPFLFEVLEVCHGAKTMPERIHFDTVYIQCSSCGVVRVLEKEKEKGVCWCSLDNAYMA